MEVELGRAECWEGAFLTQKGFSHPAAPPSPAEVKTGDLGDSGPEGEGSRGFPCFSREL